MDETWNHGAILGGMAHDAYTQMSIADGYALAADTLVDAILEGKLQAHEIAYPILFNYRHAIELYLKVAVKPSNRDHDIPALFAAFRQAVQTRLNEQVPDWFSAFVLELAEIDPRSTVFRYQVAGQASERLRDTGEHWIDFRKLKEHVGAIRRGFHSVTDALGQRGGLIQVS